MATAFSSPDQIVEAAPIADNAQPNLEQEQLEEVFEIGRCEAWVKTNGYSRVCLQFPDHLLHEAAPVARELQQRLGQDVFILGDTTFGACCVDEVAAAHMNADSVIHFGHTCLTPSRTLPVLYIYTRLDLCLSSLADALSSLPLVLLVWDVQYDHLLGPWQSPPGVVKAHCNQDSEGIIWLGRKVAAKSMDEVESATVVYVGRGEETLLGVVHSLPSNKVLHWENNSLIPVGHAVTKLLMRRYFLVEKTKDADRIGLLVGTLGSQQCTEMLEKLRKVVKSADKRAYTFLVGKPNVAKLANFPEIDVFVLVACTELTFIDSKEFLQPVITPWELEIACNKELDWTGEYITDFKALLPGGSHYQPPSERRGEGEDEEVGDMSLVSGRMRGMGLGGNSGSGELMVVNDKTVASLHEGGGGQFLASKSWSGLEQKLGATKVTGVVEGTIGIAAGYEKEPT